MFITVYLLSSQMKLITPQHKHKQRKNQQRKEIDLTKNMCATQKTYHTMKETKSTEESTEMTEIRNSFTKTVR
jgi:hypothetical protein